MPAAAIGPCVGVTLNRRVTLNRARLQFKFAEPLLTFKEVA